MAVLTGFGGTLTINGVTIPIKSWQAVIVQHWYDAWKRRMNRG